MRYWVIALTLVVVFETGFFIPVVSDLFVNRRLVAPGASAIAQTTGQRIAIEQSGSSPRQEGSLVRVQNSFNFFIAGPTGEGEEAQKLREKARRIVYEMAAHECDLLLEVLAKDAGWSPSTTISISIGNSSSRKVLPSTDRSASRFC